MAAAPSLLASGDKYDDLLAPNEEMAAIESSVMDVDAFDLPYGDDAADYASDNVVSSEDELSSIHTAVQVSVPVIGIADAISVDEASVTYNEEEGVASIIIADDYVGSKDLQEQLVTSSTIAATSANDIWAEALCRATEIPIFASTYLAFNVSDEYDLLVRTC